MNAKSIVLAAIALTSVFASSVADDALPHTLAISGEVGTTGFGGSVWLTANDHFVFTAGYSGLNGDHGYSTDGVDYNGAADLSNGYAVIRWHPMGGHFNISAGGVMSENKITVVGSPQDGTTYEIDGVSYPASLVGSIVGDVTWEKSLVPFLGFGWAKSPTTEGWGAFLDIGVIKSGSANATLNATGIAATDPTFQRHLRVEEQNVNDKLDTFDVFPVARLGLMYRF